MVVIHEYRFLRELLEKTYYTQYARARLLLHTIYLI